MTRKPMPRRRRCDGPAAKARPNVNHHLPVDDSSMDDDMDDCEGQTEGQPLQRNAANARERARMRVLSRAFCRLKTTLPWVPADTKLSKLDTLRLATSYIAHLRDVLLVPAGEAATPGAASGHTSSHATGASPNPLNLTWPFAFPQTGAPGVPSLPGPEPWISRGSSTASSRAILSSSRLCGPATTNAHCPGLSSGASSNASSSGADDDVPVKDDEAAGHDDVICRRGRGLSGGHLVELQQYHPMLHRYVDVVGSGAL